MQLFWKNNEADFHELIRSNFQDGMCLFSLKNHGKDNQKQSQFVTCRGRWGGNEMEGTKTEQRFSKCTFLYVFPLRFFVNVSHLQKIIFNQNEEKILRRFSIIFNDTVRHVFVLRVAL